MHRIPALLTLLVLSFPLAAQAAKQRSAFYPPVLTGRAKANAARHPWAARMHKAIVEQAAPWMRFSDEQLWSMVFGSTITRSHMVWSAGHCPACKRPVPMYDWQIDALERPWKVRCPRCREIFPKNDFHRFYQSGLDEHGVFDPRRADRSLLVNAGHPDPADPLHRFGVDDGEGYVEGPNRWRFVGAYLLYGQWWQLVLGGIEKLAAAYTVTGDPAYAHRAAILLDRVADVFPTFDYAAQGLVYELARYGGGAAGYVSYSIDSAYDVRKLALSYDQVFEGMRDDATLVRFLSAKATRHGLSPKKTLADIRGNIEQRILRDALAHPEKMRTNYPGREGAVTIVKTVLDWPANRAEVLASIDEMVAAGTSVDGITGEKGLNGYATIAPRFLAHMLELYARVDAGLLENLLRRHPKFARTYSFFTDMWVGRQYYPSAGDAGAFAVRDTRYAGLTFNRGDLAGKMEMAPPVSMFSFLWRFYQATRDPLYLQLMRQGNGGKVDGLPYDLFAEDPAAMAAAVERAGDLPKPRSVNKTEWRIAMLRSPHDEHAAVWLDYDSVPNCAIKSHYHRDALNLGLYAKGLDLLPEFGYPAVQFGSWHTPQARWHGRTAAHNTVVVDGKDQAGGDGRTTLWVDGAAFRAVRASSPAQIQGRQYERTAAMVDTAGADFYVLDVFRVIGGEDHAKFTRGYFGEATPRGLHLEPGPDYGHGTLTRNFRVDRRPEPGWSADWKAEDRLGYLAPGADVHLAYTDLTSGAEAWLCESWTVRNLTSTEEFWIPTVVTRRRGKDLASTFVAVLEPYEKRSAIVGIRRLPLATPAGAAYGDAHVAVEVRLADGRRDVLIAADAENPLQLVPSLAAGERLVQAEAGIQVGAELALVRRGAAGAVERVALSRGDYLRAGELEVRLKQPAFVELAVEGGRVSLAAGDRAAIAEVRLRGKAAAVR